MTAQISDEIIFNSLQYSIAAKRGDSLFQPWAYGIRPVGVSTSCWRGFRCVYALRLARTCFNESIRLSFRQWRCTLLFGPHRTSRY